MKVIAGIIVLILSFSGPNNGYYIRKLTWDKNRLLLQLQNDSGDVVNGKYMIYQEDGRRYVVYGGTRLFIDINPPPHFRQKLDSFIIQTYDLNRIQYPQYYPQIFFAFIIDADGHIIQQGVSGLSSDEPFQLEGLRVSRAFRGTFPPYLINGKPVAVLYTPVINPFDMEMSR